jgi:hypothetical protein
MHLHFPVLLALLTATSYCQEPSSVAPSSIVSGVGSIIIIAAQSAAAEASPLNDISMGTDSLSATGTEQAAGESSLSLASLSSYTSAAGSSISREMDSQLANATASISGVMASALSSIKSSASAAASSATGGVPQATVGTGGVVGVMGAGGAALLAAAAWL